MRPDVRGVDAAVPELDRKDDFLDAFKRLGCYLEDLSQVPVTTSTRAAARTPRAPRRRHQATRASNEAMAAPGGRTGHGEDGGHCHTLRLATKPRSSVPTCHSRVGVLAEALRETEWSCSCDGWLVAIRRPNQTCYSDRLVSHPTLPREAAPSQRGLPGALGNSG